MEPAAMLVRPFEIKRSRPAKLRTLFENESVRRAGIEPHLDDVGDLLPVGRVVLVSKKRLRVGRVPGVGARALDGLRDSLDNRAVAQRLAGPAVGEDRDRYAPGALPRDAPIRPALDHR